MQPNDERPPTVARSQPNASWWRSQPLRPLAPRPRPCRPAPEERVQDLLHARRRHIADQPKHRVARLQIAVEKGPDILDRDFCERTRSAADGSTHRRRVAGRPGAFGEPLERILAQGADLVQHDPLFLGETPGLNHRITDLRQQQLERPFKILWQAFKRNFDRLVVGGSVVPDAHFRRPPIEFERRERPGALKEHMFGQMGEARVAAIEARPCPEAEGDGHERSGGPFVDHVESADTTFSQAGRWALGDSNHDSVPASMLGFRVPGLRPAPLLPMEFDMIEDKLTRDFLRVAERAAVAAARTMGQGERRHSDHVAVEAMRTEMDLVAMNGEIVIGEGERDEAPLLYTGEKVGKGGDDAPFVDIAVDPLEGTNLCATGSPGAIAVLAASNRGGLLRAPDCYMEKIIVGPQARGLVHLDATVAENLKAIAGSLDRSVNEMVVIVLDRPRHEQLIEDIRRAGARIRLIGDGDLSAGISAAVRGTDVHAVMGTGGAPEGVLAAAAMRCLNGGMQGRLVPARDGQTERLAAMGVTDLNRIYTERDLAPGDEILFVASGVTDGTLLRGVRFFGHGTRIHSVVMSLRRRRIRFIDSVELDDDPSVGVEF